MASVEKSTSPAAVPEGVHNIAPPAEDNRVAWKEIEPGRFQPQRIKGSCLGRELG